MINILDDVSKITSIPKIHLDKLIEKSVWCICDAVEDMVLQDEKLIELDIGIGTLLIHNDENSIKYKFIPNDYLENAVSETINCEHNPLIDNLEKSLVNRIINTYKDIM